MFGAYLLNYFNSTWNNIISRTGDLTHLQYLNLQGNLLRDLPTTMFSYNNLSSLNGIFIDHNCIDPDIQDIDDADWIDNYHGNYRRNNQYLCADVSYDPEKPVT
ncbi:MAG: hypothetical protein LBI53_00210 [Candidatus Peribacteria bacterium]|jgi:hypothetical protein|nr:hypothetical protein [Candidatus Peribacteria bacterium]